MSKKPIDTKWSKRINKVVLLLVAFAFVGYVGTVIGYNVQARENTDDTTAMDPQHLHDLVNQVRERSGLQPLTYNGNLGAAASSRCSLLVEHNVFSHTLPIGYDYATVIKANLPSATLVGENLTYGESNPDEAFTSWMDSPEHREAMLSSQYTDSGTAICKADNFLNEGRPAYIFIQDFAKL